MSTSSKPNSDGPNTTAAKPPNSIILEEEIDPNYVPTENEVLEYATKLKPCKTTDNDEIFYFNFATGESTWDHPCDEFYRDLYRKEKNAKPPDFGENFGPNSG
ncbi:hypothetical protein TrRE_jg11512 [Triparma retinervis]|uniref:WW domain-containing protein n=1 Tax=Triparma retinervis TaxID=2557542 RepID=A0A9W7AEK9_9STRA|nr:hypothetical protein TrRE_jg11512 [Triparma retinervis]